MSFFRMVWLLVLSFFISSIINVIYVDSNSPDDDRAALIAFRDKMTGSCTLGWDETVGACTTWSHVRCDVDQRVIRVDLGGCNMEGSLVDELGKLSKLQYLVLWGNFLNGSIPSAIGQLTNLKLLDLTDNFIDGLPSELGSLHNLEQLDLSFNNLNGAVPIELSQNFPNIAKVNLTKNQGPGGLNGDCTQTLCCYGQPTTGNCPGE